MHLVRHSLHFLGKIKYRNYMTKYNGAYLIKDVTKYGMHPQLIYLTCSNSKLPYPDITLLS